MQIWHHSLSCLIMSFPSPFGFITLTTFIKQEISLFSKELSLSFVEWHYFNETMFLNEVTEFHNGLETSSMSLIDVNFSPWTCKFMYFLQYDHKGDEKIVNINQTIKICLGLCAFYLFYLFK